MGRIAKKEDSGVAVRNRFVAPADGVVDARKLLWNQEGAILDTTELICEVMEEEGVTRAELASRMGKTKGYVTQLLSGDRNMTIRTVADVFTHLGREFRASYKGRDEKLRSREVFKVKVMAEFTVELGATDSQFVKSTRPTDFIAVQPSDFAAVLASRGELAAV